MSVISCDQCGFYVDTDYDVECYIEKLNIWLCLGCREKLPEEHQND